MDQFEDAARQFLLSSPFVDQDPEGMMVQPLAKAFREWYEAGQTVGLLSVLVRCQEDNT